MTTNAKNSTRFTLGTIVLSVSLFTAWAVGRDGAAPDAARMDEVLAASASNDLAGVKWDLPVTRNDRVDTWIDFLQNGNKDNTELWLERSGKYTPMIREQLRERRVGKAWRRGWGTNQRESGCS